VSKYYTPQTGKSLRFFRLSAENCTATLDGLSRPPCHQGLILPQIRSGISAPIITYTMRFNLRHKLSGHLFAGRYKSLLVDEATPGYLRAVCDYVHLNPARAKLPEKQERLQKYRWSSYPSYLRGRQNREAWLRCDRLLGEHGLLRDSCRSRLEFARRMGTAASNQTIRVRIRFVEAGPSERRISSPGYSTECQVQ